MRKYLQDEENAIYDAYARYQHALAELQESCQHKVILKAGRQANMWGDIPHIRICEDCGLEEETPWDSGWKILVGRAYDVPRQEIYRTRPHQTYIPKEVNVPAST